MTLDEFREVLRRDEALEREGLSQVIAERPDGPAVVGKHQAKNWAHLRAVIAEAQGVCPLAAETIRWLLWHGVLDAQRVMMMAEDIEPSADTHAALAAHDKRVREASLREAADACDFVEADDSLVLPVSNYIRSLIEKDQTDE